MLWLKARICRIREFHFTQAAMMEKSELQILSGDAKIQSFGTNSIRMQKSVYGKSMPGNSAPLMTSTRIKTIAEAGRIAWVFPEGLHMSPKPRPGTNQIPVKNCHCHRLSLCKDTLGKHYIRANAPSKQIPSMDLKEKHWT